MDRVTYNGRNMTSSNGANKIALIDSGNITIQVPELVFENLLKAMKEKEGAIGSHKLGGKEIMIAHKPCD
jgi:hypothetical protein